MSAERLLYEKLLDILDPPTECNEVAPAGGLDEDTVAPYVVYKVTHREEERDLAGELIFENIFFDIIIVADENKEAEEIQDLITLDLDRYQSGGWMFSEQTLTTNDETFDRVLGYVAINLSV